MGYFYVSFQVSEAYHTDVIVNFSCCVISQFHIATTATKREQPDGTLSITVSLLDFRVAGVSDSGTCTSVTDCCASFSRKSGLSPLGSLEFLSCALGYLFGALAQSDFHVALLSLSGAVHSV